MISLRNSLMAGVLLMALAAGIGAARNVSADAWPPLGATVQYTYASYNASPFGQFPVLAQRHGTVVGYWSAVDGDTFAPTANTTHVRIQFATLVNRWYMSYSYAYATPAMPGPLVAGTFGWIPPAP